MELKCFDDSPDWILMLIQQGRARVMPGRSGDRDLGQEVPLQGIHQTLHSFEYFPRQLVAVELKILQYPNKRPREAPVAHLA